MKRDQRDAYNAGRDWVKDNKESLTKTQDLQSQAMDLAQGAGLDPEYVYEGMLAEQAKMKEN